MKIIEYSELKNTYSFFANKIAKAIYVFIVIVILIILAGVLWCIFGFLDDTVRASTLLRPYENVSTVRTKYGGRIKEVLFENGAHVNQGDSLIIIDTFEAEAELKKQQTSLKLCEKENRVSKVLLSTIDNEVITVVEEDTEILSKSQTYLSELKQLKQETEEAKILYEREVKKPKMFTTSQSIDDYLNQYNKAKLKLETFISDSRYQALLSLNNSEAQIIQITETINTLQDQIDFSVLKAPISGTVKTVSPILVNENIFAQESVLQIIPDSEERLKAELYIKTADIGRVEEGNRVRIKLEGLSPARFGYVEGNVILVPPDYTAMQTEEPVFIVEAEIEDLVMTTKHGEQTILKPGLKGEARVVVGREKAYVMLLRKLDFLW